MFALIATLAGLAIVTQDQASLRASPRDSATQQAVLSAGDTLEIRGEKIDYLQVYDHRRERAGYIRASQVRPLSLDAGNVPDLLAVLRFVRDTPGSEALGIGYAAAYLKAAPADAITAEPFDAIGSMAERLARRASAKQATVGAAITPLASQLEGVASYGVKFTSYERDAAIQLCYDGDAFRRVLAMPSATPIEKAHAALAVTRDDCIDPQMRATDRMALDRWRAEVLDRIPAVEFASLPDALKNRMRMRRAAVWSVLAFQASKGADVDAIRGASERAWRELATIDRLALGDDDQIEYNDAAIRVGASRWGAEPLASSISSTSPASMKVTSGRSGVGQLRIETEAGQPGETCVLLVDAAHQAASPLAKRCTYGTVWTASASVQPNGHAIAVAVLPLAAWRELWVFRVQGNAWVIDVLPPASSGPELGYVEFAGWVGGSHQMLVARESRVDGRYKRNFELISIATLNTDKQQSNPASLGEWFTKWQDAAWKRGTVSLR